MTLIERTGTVISDGDPQTWADAMEQAGAQNQLAEPQDGLFRLPTTRLPSVGLVDPAGGVLLAGRIREALLGWLSSAIRYEQVVGVDVSRAGVRLRLASGSAVFDALVICAGAGTPDLASQAGLSVPDVLEHHARFSFRLAVEVQGALQSWLGTSAVSGFGTYQHRTADGLWAVGGHCSDADVNWDLDGTDSVARQREAVQQYVADELDLVAAEPVEELYCTPAHGLTDGFRILRNGPCLAVYGENLFKMAPVLARRVASAVTDAHAPLVFGATYS